MLTNDGNYKIGSQFYSSWDGLFLWFRTQKTLMFVLSSSDKEEPDAEAVSSMLGFQSYWDAAYADELANFREHGHAGEVW